jgi:hypothetical protein
MNDHEFELLKVRASVTPQKEAWPSPNIAVSIMGDGPTISGALYWSALHACVDDNRARVTKTLTKIAAINADKQLSAMGRASRKADIAAAAVAELEQSEKLAAAREAVTRQVAKWEKDLGITPNTPDTVGGAQYVGDTFVQREIRAHLASLEPTKRMAFIEAHVTEVAAAVLGAPAFLSGLTPTEMAVVKQRIAARTNPEVAKARADLLQAMQDVEAGHRAAISQINASVKEGTKGVSAAAAVSVAAAPAPVARQQADEKNGKYLEVTPKKKEPAEPRRAAPRWN